MSDANPLAWVLASLKTHPEPVSIPDVSKLTPVELAEIRSRLQTFSQVATELRKLVDVELAGALQGSAFRYGNDVYRASNGGGRAKVVDEDKFYEAVARGIERTEDDEMAGLLAALFPAYSVRISGLPRLAEALDVPSDVLKATLIDYEPSTTPLSVMPIQKAPKYLQDLEEGEIR